MEIIKHINIEKTSFVIFDRDGTLIELVPYLKDPSKVKLLKNTIDKFPSFNYSLNIVEICALFHLW